MGAKRLALLLTELFEDLGVAGDPKYGSTATARVRRMKRGRRRTTQQQQPPTQAVFGLGMYLGIADLITTRTLALGHRAPK